MIPWTNAEYSMEILHIIKPKTILFAWRTGKPGLRAMGNITVSRIGRRMRVVTGLINSIISFVTPLFP